MPSPLPLVALVGRPNVGKSTLFNRLTRTRRAIVTPVPGTTRDVISLVAEWGSARFEIVDTGGMFGASEDPLHALVLERGRRAITDADLLIFIVDGREGIVPGDEAIAEVVRSSGKPAILTVNKCDDRRARAGALEAHRLGFDPVLEVSAEHGEGTGELLDEVVRQLGPTAVRSSRAQDNGVSDAELSATADGGAAGDPVDGDDRRNAPAPEVGVAIVGRPNAGKSSLVNRLLREERMIVSELPGTTRDSVDSVLVWHRRKFRIVDTAGIRRPGRVAKSGQVESVSVLLARRSIEAADVVVLVIDAKEGVTDQDAAIAGEAVRAGRGIILAVNKWDLMKDQEQTFSKTFDEEVRRSLKFLDYAAILHVSAATGERTPRLLETIDRVAAARRQRVRTADLNRFIEKIAAEHPPASPGRRHVRILYAAQTSVAPPTFVLFTNTATTFHFSYERFLENRLREEFGFAGTPIRIQARARRARPGTRAGDDGRGGSPGRRPRVRSQKTRSR